MILHTAHNCVTHTHSLCTISGTKTKHHAKVHAQCVCHDAQIDQVKKDLIRVCQICEKKTPSLCMISRRLQFLSIVFSNCIKSHQSVPQFPSSPVQIHAEFQTQMTSLSIPRMTMVLLMTTTRHTHKIFSKPSIDGSVQAASGSA